MPIITITDSITKFLKTINYIPNEDTISTSSNTLKQNILDDGTLPVLIKDKSSFHVHLHIHDFNELLQNTFHHNYVRYEEQKKQISLSENSTSTAWRLITIYYTAFFATNAITNISGFFNLNITNEERKKLFDKNTSSDNESAKEFLNNGPTNFFGQAKMIDADNTVQISFQSGGGKPHELAWGNLHRLLAPRNRKDTNKYAQVIRLMHILKNKYKWRKPNQIRNEWNYSKPELYAQQGHIYHSNFSRYLNQFHELNKWAEKIKNGRRNKEDDVISIIYIYSILDKVMQEAKSKIL